MGKENQGREKGEKMFLIGSATLAVVLVGQTCVEPTPKQKKKKKNPHTKKKKNKPTPRKHKRTKSRKR